MYLQLTSRCNMRCGHCCFDCTEVGTDMSTDVWNAAITTAFDQGMSFTLGGGEPTLHPEFGHILDLVTGRLLHNYNGVQVGFITNGSHTEHAMRAHEMQVDFPSFWAALSVGICHDMTKVDEQVVRLYSSTGLTRNDPVWPTRAGRAVRAPWERQCACTGLFVRPSGVVTGCACATAELGSFANGSAAWLDLCSYPDACCAEFSQYTTDIPGHHDSYYERYRTNERST